MESESRMKKLPSNYILSALAAIGAVISFFLIRKYFGGQGGDGVAQALCDALSETGSCNKVSESAVSAIRNVPFFGDIPIALFGFVFYGLLAFLFVRSETQKEESVKYLLLAFYLLIVGFVIDLGLFATSVFYIDAVCGLCAATWAVTVLLLVGTYIQIRDIKDKSPAQLIPSISKEALNYVIVILGALVIGLIGGRSFTNSLVEGEHTGLSRIQKQLSDYEAAPTVSIDIKGASFQGDPNAPITIVKFADFNCGHCMHTSHILKKILRDYDGVVKVVYKNFPLDGSCNRLISSPRPEASSCVAASAAICADKQKKFPAMYDSLYKNTENQVMHTLSTVLAQAQDLKLDMNQFRSCLSSVAVKDQINHEVDEADKLQIHSTPSLFINNKPIESGTPKEEFLRALIENLIKKI